MAEPGHGFNQLSRDPWSMMTDPLRIPELPLSFHETMRFDPLGNIIGQSHTSFDAFGYSDSLRINWP